MSADVAEGFQPGGWEFTPEVVEVFDDHVRASVPHYDVIQNMVIATSDWLLPSGGLIADLGSSTGTTVAAILARHPTRRLRYALYDESRPMLDQAQVKIDPEGKRDRQSAIYSTNPVQRGPFAHHEADLTTCLFILQFLPFPDRVAALRLARRHAAASGALLVAEKVRPSDARWAEMAAELSWDWKAEHGIGDEAIRAKARALRGVLRPYPADALTDAILASGWVDPEIIFRWHNWVLIGAFATHDGLARPLLGPEPTSTMGTVPC